MAGQGSLRQVTHHGSSHARAAMIVCALALVGTSVAVNPCIAQTETGESQVDLNLRLSWSTDEQRFWQIRVAVVGEENTESAAISEIINRCSSLAATGAFQLSADNKAITFTPRGSLADGEYDFRFKGAPHTRLRIQIADNQQYVRPPSSPSDRKWDSIPSSMITVDELARGEAITEPIDSTANENSVAWSITRTSNDQLRIEGLSGSGFAEVSDTFSFSVRANSLTNWASQDLTLVYALRQAATGKVVAEKRWPVKVDAEGNTVSVDVDEPAPAVPGVYEISCRLEKGDDHLLMRLRRRPSLVAATAVPIVVTVPASAGPNAPATTAWQRVGQIQPATDTEWELNQWLPNSSKRLIRRIDPRESSNMKQSRHAGEAVSVLAPGESYIALLPSRQPHYPHKITLRYPAGLQARMRVEVDASEDFQHPSREFLIADEDYNAESETWRSYTFVHYPGEREQFIRLTNQSQQNDLQFATITVDSGGSTLANSLPVTEASQRVAALNVSGLNWVDELTTDIADSGSQRQLHPNTRAIHRVVTAAERLIDYAAAAGLNAIMVDGCQGDQTWFETGSLFPNRRNGRFSGRNLQSLMQVADARSMRVIVRVNLSAHISQIESAMLADPELRGVLRRLSESTIRYNTQHEIVQNQIRALLESLHGQLRQHESYAGLVLDCGNGTHLCPISPRYLDIATVQAFAASVQKQNLTQSQLFAWIQSTGREQLAGWLQDRSLQLYRSLTTNIDGNVYLVGPVGSIDPQTNTKLSVVTDLRRYASDSLENKSAASMRAGARQAVGHPSVVLLGQRGHDQSHVNSFMRPESVKDMTDVIVGLDPEMLIIDDSAMTLGLSPTTYEMVTGFCSLPRTSLQETAGADAAARTVRVRYAVQGEKTILVLNNLAPWSSDVQLDLASNLNWSDAVEATADDSAADRQNQWSIDQHRLKASLAPGGMLVLQGGKSAADQNRSPVLAWSSRVSGGERAMTDIKDKVTAVVERIGALADPDAYDHLSNGGFEKTAGVGIPGWMHTQHPQGAVRIDNREAMVGSQSALLTNDQNNSSRAWLVSETINPPSSGRLAVSLACRAETTSGDATSRVRVSIEGIRDGQPFRKSDEFEIQRDGQWKPRKVVLEAGSLDPSEVNSVRLTIDSLSPGRVWIDDIHLHDWFPTKSEREELQGEAFLAVQGLQRGNVTPAARLLHNYWAQYLINQKQTKQLAPVIQTTEEHEEPPGVAERIKSWLPRPLRF